MHNTGVYRKPAVLVLQHLLSLEGFKQAPPDAGAQDVPTQAGLGLGHCIRIHTGGRVEN
jgi:hypothetical protein